MVETNKNFGVFVLGEIGRSPRMQYHALSISRACKNSNVHFIGIKGPEPLKRLSDMPNVSFHHIRTIWSFLPSTGFLFFLFLPFKFLFQFFSVFFTLFFEVPFLNQIIVQTPPALPTLVLIYLYSLLGCNVVIDWHNFGYTLLGLRENIPKIVVNIAYFLEKIFSSRKRYRHICVSNTMKEWLKENWKITATVVYDRPAEIFRELTLTEIHNFLSRFFKENIFTGVRKDGTIYRKKDRPAIIVSSTSWTKDEDFSILLRCLQQYDGMDFGPALHVIITGKGPMKEYYQNKIYLFKWKRVSIKLAWLKMEDYPLLLGSADLGISLHYSSSGIDLPMKVVDMFGCCLPVCAIHFKALKELVRHEKNGLVFKDERMLLEQLRVLLKTFPRNTAVLKMMRKNLRRRLKKWDDEWKKIKEWW